jgi:tetratricopeptide (TPR) repeat protein
MLSVPQLIQQGVQHHTAGRFADAEAMYLKALDRAPNEPAALHLFGVLRHQQGRNAEALELVRRAVRLSPNDADAHVNLTSICRAVGDVEGAVTAGNRATQLSPRSPEAWNNLGLALKMNKWHAQALDALRRALQLRPNYVEAITNIGNTLNEMGRHDEAIAAHQAAMRIRPSASSLFNIGLALRGAQRVEEALQALTSASRAEPNNAEFAATLGDQLLEMQRYEQAIQAYRSASRINPNLARIFNNYGFALRELNRIDEAVAAHTQGLQLAPASADAHFNLALSLLWAGDYENGWREHEWRWQSTGFTSAPRDLSQPVWDGSTDPAGRSILIHAEQGFGDTLQFVRYAPLLAPRGAKVIVESQPQVTRLLRSLPGVDKVVSRGDALPEFDLRVAMMSLPYAFRTTLETVPTNIPYLTPDLNDVERWRSRVEKEEDPGQLKLGLAWAGNPNRALDTTRSIALKQFAPLADVPGVRLYSLQKLLGSEQVATAPASMRTIDYTSELNDFADTAALIANLDLVASIDSAVAHLAGAMGKPVWVVLPFAGGWRWLTDRTDSPWYPTARLFRQPTPGDWTSVIHALVEALRDRRNSP